MTDKSQLIATKQIDTPTKQTDSNILVGISACLLGEEVRFNGGHSRSKYCCGPLQDYFRFEKFCPEVAAGFGIPRATLRLIGDPHNPRMVYTRQQDNDVTEQFHAGYQARIEKLGHLDGYILAKNSPSCGMERVKVYQPNSHPHDIKSAGLFAKALMQRYPHLPVEEDGRLNDAHLRENFVQRVFAHNTFRTLVMAEPSIKNLLAFHSQYKYTLMAHSQTEYKNLGQLLGQAHQDYPINELCDLYLQRFMQAISKPASRGNHYNVMLHLFGYLKPYLEVDVKQDILGTFENYLKGYVNLATALTLLHHYLRMFGNHYVQTQRYLSPYPKALGLRNQV